MSNLINLNPIPLHHPSLSHSHLSILCSQLTCVIIMHSQFSAALCLPILRFCSTSSLKSINTFTELFWLTAIIPSFFKSQTKAAVDDSRERLEKFIEPASDHNGWPLLNHVNSFAISCVPDSIVVDRVWASCVQ